MKLVGGNIMEGLGFPAWPFDLNGLRNGRRSKAEVCAQITLRKITSFTCYIALRNLSVGAADYGNDGLPDLFVANDGLPAYLYHNARGKIFGGILAQIEATGKKVIQRRTASRLFRFRDLTAEGINAPHIKAEIVTASRRIRVDKSPKSLFLYFSQGLRYIADEF
jgi:hypothetical protein